MHSFEAEIKRNVEDGELSAIGVVWTSVRYPLSSSMMGLGLWALAGAAGALGLSFIVPPVRVEGVQMTSAGLFGVSCLFFAMADWLGKAKGALFFTADGSIKAPHGLPIQSRIRESLRDIVTFQVDHNVPVRALGEDAATCHVVNLYTRNGNIIRIAEGLRREQAHKITVLLINALTEMRESLSRLAHTRRAQPDRRMAALID